MFGLAAISRWCPRQRCLDAGLEVMTMQDVDDQKLTSVADHPPPAYMPHGAYQLRPFEHAGGGRKGSMQIPQRRSVPRRQGCSQDHRLNGFLLGIISPTTSNTTLGRNVKRKQLNAALC